MNIRGSAFRLAWVALTVFCVPVFAAMEREDSTRQQASKTIKLTSSQAQKVMSVFQEENFSLSDALDKAEYECSGTPVAAESSVISEQEFQRVFAKDDEQHSGHNVLIQIACATAQRPGLELIAVCPETDETTRMAADFGQGFGRTVRFQNDEWNDDDQQRAPYGHSNRSRYDDDWREDTRYHDPNDENGDDDNWARGRDRQPWREDQFRDQARDNRFGRDDRWYDRGRQGMGVFKGTNVIGANVENHDGEDLGSIEDVAIDPRTGRIKYVVLQSGGFMGIGGKYFAVPWEALQPRGQDEYVVNIDEQTLERLPGFNDDNWPPSANARLFRQRGRGFDEQQAGRFDQDDAERRGFITRPQFRQTGQMNIAPNQARLFAKALEQNNFTLKEAIHKGEQHCNGKAVAAKCAYANQRHSYQTRGPLDDSDRQIDWDTQTEYSRQDRNQQQGTAYDSAPRTGTQSSNVVVEVTCLKQGETGKATIVVISPADGEVITTREETLTQARRTSDPGNM